MKPCFECGGSGVCPCIICDGSCVVCAARAFRERNAAILDMFDPRDHRLWLWHPAHDGTKGYREYLPLKGLK